MNLEKKKNIAADIHEKFLKSQIVLVTDYKGLDVAAMSDLRRRLKAEGSEYQVVKNSLLIRASENTDAAVIKDYFKGPTAIALSDSDPVGAAKVLTDFAKGNDKLEIRGGVMNGKALDINAVTALSALPSREVLLAQLLSTMNAVPTGWVRVLSGVPRAMLNVLNAIKAQKEEATS